MNKKTLYMILIVPFIIALLGFSNVLIIKNFIEVDISDIAFTYQDNEGFKINSSTLLEATPVVGEGLKVSEGNELMWYLKLNENNEDVAKITYENNNYYLNALKEGEIEVVCSNVKKTKSKSFNAVIYENGAIIINPSIKGSGYSLDNIRDYGEYDITYNKNTLDESTLKKVNASLSFTLKEYPLDSSSYYLEDKSNNIDLEIINNEVKVKVNGSGKAYFTLRSSLNSYIKATHSFNIVDEGINVYDYLDLLMCTNKSNKGEIVCLQRSLESKANTFNKDNTYKDNNVRLFGNEAGLNFKNEVYTFNSTYNSNFIYQVFNKETSQDDVISGIRVQKDFYGNGYIINGKELAYPNNGKINQYSGKLEPGEKDLFKGPKTFFSIGQFEAPVVKAFGQDNSLMYIEGNNITVDDLIIECSDTFSNSSGSETATNNLFNLEYTGSVIDCLGENITIKNSELRNGRTCLRVYNSPNFKLENSLLSTAREFLMKIGNNEYKEINTNKEVSFNHGGLSFKGSLKDFLENKAGFNADTLIEQILLRNDGSEEVGLELLNRLQANLDNVSLLNDEINYGQEITIEDCYFYRSGIFSIALDTYFNGAFLYDGSPDFISENLKQVLGNKIVIPNNISGTMIPSKVNIIGDTRFYDWKDVESINASCLIEERLGEFLGSLGMSGFEDLKPNIDDYFPMKALLKEESMKNNLIYTNDEKDYLNTEIAFYGGGKNLSSVNFDGSSSLHISKEILIDFLKFARKQAINTSGEIETMVGAFLAKCVPVAAGFNKFKFYLNEEIKEGVTPYLFGERPSKEDLKNRVIGA